jgi:uncharacterized protein DUF4232
MGLIPTLPNVPGAVGRITRLGSLLAVGSVALGLGACGGPAGHQTPPAGTPTTTQPPASSTSTTAASAQTQACVAGQLAVVLGQGGGAAGSVGTVVSFKNTSGTACSLYGYPGLQMLDATGKPIPTEVIRGTSTTVPSVPEAIVSVAPGAEASFDLGYADGTGFGSASCPTSTEVEFTPPNATQQITVPWQIQPYGGGSIAQLQCGQITVSPVYAGSGTS